MARGHAPSSRVLIADDDAEFARTVERVLELHGYTCETVDGTQPAIGALERGEYDLLLTDLDMPGNDRNELLYVAAARDLPTIIVTGFPTLESAVEALRLGVLDYVTKTAPLEDLLARVQRALSVRLRGPTLRATNGGSAEDSVDLDVEGVDRLSGREREIVIALARGFRVQQIAEGLEISIHTVRNHLRSIFRKLDVHSQAELIELLHA